MLETAARMQIYNRVWYKVSAKCDGLIGDKIWNSVHEHVLNQVALQTVMSIKFAIETQIAQ